MNGNSPKSKVGERVQELRQEIAANYPDLTIGCDETKIYIRGTFPIQYEGKVLGRYQIEIEWSDSDSYAPVLRETGGRIPRTDDRHINRRDGTACVLVPEEWLLRSRSERTAIKYLDGPVRDFFIWQSLVEQGQEPTWKARSHGFPGAMEAYADMVGMTEPKQIVKCLEYLSKGPIKGHWDCPCGSGKRLRNCHYDHLRGLTGKIPRRIAQLSLERLRNRRKP